MAAPMLLHSPSWVRWRSPRVLDTVLVDVYINPRHYYWSPWLLDILYIILGEGFCEQLLFYFMNSCTFIITISLLFTFILLLHSYTWHFKVFWCSMIRYWPDDLLQKWFDIDGYSWSVFYRIMLTAHLFLLYFPCVFAMMSTSVEYCTRTA